MEKNLWLVYVALAGLAWGTYVPIIFYGGGELGGKPLSRMLAILCVGGAYFVLAVLIPLYFLFAGSESDKPTYSTNGLVFSSLAGVAGAVGALCVVFASGAAVASAKATGLPPGTYRAFIAPLIFGLAPIINVLVSSIWHPQPGNAFHFTFEPPGWKLWVGILLVGMGAALVLYSKEEAESQPKHAAAKVAPVAPPAGGVS